MTESNPHRLNKSLFAAGLQCAKRLYQEFHDPDSIPESREIRKTLAEVGIELMEMACAGFPNGERVEETDHAAAVARTAELLKSESGAAIFDAAFERDGVEIRCDVVLPSRDATVDIFEVKAGTKIKQRHVMDVALQMWVLEGAGYEVRHASLLHLDAEYRHDGEKTYPVHKLFKNADVSKKAKKRKGRVADYIDGFQLILDDPGTMDLPTGTWCINPIPCCYRSKCDKAAPPHSLVELPDLTPAQESELHQAGIETIDQIPPETPSLTPVQRRVLKSFAENKLCTDEIVAEELDTVIYPICFLSTELALQVMPRYEHARPWQHIPFQWTAQIVQEDGSTETRSFTADGKSDPRPGFIESLVACIEEVGTIVTWTRRMEPSLRQIMEDMPELKDHIRGLLQMDPLALDVLVRDGAYHPDQRGSYERQDVFAAYTGTKRSRKKSGIQDDEDARAAFEKMSNTRTRATTREKLAAELKAYGEAQSRAMIAIFDALKASVEVT